MDIITILFSSQIADLRDSIGILSEILKETNTTYDDLSKSIDVLTKEPSISSAYDEVLKKLNEGVTNRRTVFAVSYPIIF